MRKFPPCPTCGWIMPEDGTLRDCIVHLIDNHREEFLDSMEKRVEEDHRFMTGMN